MGWVLINSLYHFSFSLTKKGEKKNREILYTILLFILLMWHYKLVDVKNRKNYILTLQITTRFATSPTNCQHSNSGLQTIKAFEKCLI
jgi:hypothetical protein